jgi:hypothetical protein
MLENEQENPCRVDAIKYFSVHYYKCEVKQWKKNYELETGNLYKKTVKALEDLEKESGSPKKDWEGYFNSRPLMLTETNCTWDNPEIFFPTQD